MLHTLYSSKSFSSCSVCIQFNTAWLGSFVGIMRGRYLYARGNLSCLTPDIWAFSRTLFLFVYTQMPYVTFTRCCRRDPMLEQGSVKSPPSKEEGVAEICGEVTITPIPGPTALLWGRRYRKWESGKKGRVGGRGLRLFSHYPTVIWLVTNWSNLPKSSLVYPWW